FAHPTPARLHGRVILVGGLAAQHSARAKLRLELRVTGIVPQLRFLLSVEVVEVAEELVKAVDRRQVLVLVAEVILAELARGIALRLAQLRDGGSSRLQPDGSSRHTDLREPGAERTLAGDE